MYLSDLKKGSLTPGEESEGFFRRAKQLETDGEFALAQQLYEQIVEIDPDFIYAWSSLGNVLSAQGDLKNALLCYKKSLSLLPPRTEAAIVLLNKAVIETALGQDNIAIDDLNLAEKISGSNDNIIRAKAVAYSDLGDWKKSCELFSQVISSADRNAQPWWLRYSMSLFEASRGIEAVAYLQRTLNRFPDEVECKAFATALYQGLGSREEANSYWKTISRDDQILYSDELFLKDKLHWGSESITSLKSFIR